MKFRKTSPLLSTSLKFPVMSFQGVMYEISRIELNEAPYENQKRREKKKRKISPSEGHNKTSKPFEPPKTKSRSPKTTHQPPEVRLDGN